MNFTQLQLYGILVQTRGIKMFIPFVFGTAKIQLLLMAMSILNALVFSDLIRATWREHSCVQVNLKGIIYISDI